MVSIPDLCTITFFHKATGDLKFITDAVIQSNICKGPKCRLPSSIDFNKCRKEIAGALQEFCSRWRK